MSTPKRIAGERLSAEYERDQSTRYLLHYFKNLTVGELDALTDGEREELAIAAMAAMDPADLALLHTRHLNYLAQIEAE